MLKRLLNFLPRSRPQAIHQVIPRDQHTISRRDISKSALKVMYGLSEAGFEAFLVGGGVRDLLLGDHPKDFDVATNATPEQVKQLFRSARIIGRRFKIVHVRFGREVIEVTTFRDSHSDESQGSKHSARSEHGMLLRDNVYGDIRSDAIRRDFTVNALYYTLEQFSIHDFTGGIQDLTARRIRIIGDPEVRYQEDPVRMLRAVRFAAKLDFEIDSATAEPILRLGHLLGNIPPARLFEEFLKLFMGGYASSVFPLLVEYRLLQYLVPAAHKTLQQDPSGHARKLIEIALQSTDRRIASDQPVTPAFIFAALLWQPLQERESRLKADGMPGLQAHQQAEQDVTGQQLQATSIPRRFSQVTREIWDLQERLSRREGNRAERSFEHPRFRAAYDFLLMREQSGEELQGLGDWWTQYQSVSVDERLKMVAQLAPPKGKRKRRRPRRKPIDHH